MVRYLHIGISFLVLSLDIIDNQLTIATFIINATFLLIIGMAGYAIIVDRKAFSLNQIFWIFVLLFMGLAPFFQYTTGIIPWGKKIEDVTFIKANSIIISCLSVYFFVRNHLMKHSERCYECKLPSLNFDERFIRRYRGVGNIVFVICSLLLCVLSGKGLFLRSLAEHSNFIHNSSLQLLFDKVFRGAVLYFSIITIALFKEGKIKNMQLVLVLLLSFIANFPLAVPRYWAATFYIALLLICVARYLSKRIYWFRICLVGSILIVFPLLSIVRYSKDEITHRFNGIRDVFSLSFSYGDFDAYASFCSTINYVHEHGITWGKQLLTVLLFFIPRSIWNNKSVGSGALVNQLKGSDFTNFCSPIFAEGYINFGVIGAVLFIALLAWLLTRYDQYYWYENRGNFPIIFYPVAIGMCFFMLRGDLLSSFAYTVGIYITGWAFHRLLNGYRK